MAQQKKDRELLQAEAGTTAEHRKEALEEKADYSSQLFEQAEAENEQAMKIEPKLLRTMMDDDFELKMVMTVMQ